LMVVALDVGACVCAKRDPVADVYVLRDVLALFHLAGSDGHYVALLMLFFSRIGDNDPAFRGFFLFQPAYKDAVMQRSDIHSHFFDLRSIRYKTSRPILRAENLQILLPRRFQRITLLFLTLGL